MHMYIVYIYMHAETSIIQRRELVARTSASRLVFKNNHDDLRAYRWKQENNSTKRIPLYNTLA